MLRFLDVKRARISSFSFDLLIALAIIAFAGTVDNHTGVVLKHRRISLIKCASGVKPRRNDPVSVVANIAPFQRGI